MVILDFFSALLNTNYLTVYSRQSAQPLQNGLVQDKYN